MTDGVGPGSLPWFLQATRRPSAEAWRLHRSPFSLCLVLPAPSAPRYRPRALPGGGPEHDLLKVGGLAAPKKTTDPFSPLQQALSDHPHGWSWEPRTWTGRCPMLPVLRG